MYQNSYNYRLSDWVLGSPSERSARLLPDASSGNGAVRRDRPQLDRLFDGLWFLLLS